MNSEHWIELSRRVYARLLNLYPSVHRLEYGPAMLQVFTDQCRTAWKARRGRGLVGLWMRSLVDLSVSVLREQLAVPDAASGLLEAVPNQPLPWKSVALVLIPSLAFAVAQIVQLTGQDRFYLLVYRAGYFMILPVLVVWFWKRRFPIWGLIPLGVLANTLADLGSPLHIADLSSDNPILSWVVNVFMKYSTVERIGLVAGVFLVVVVLVGLEVRRKKIPPPAWILLGIYLMLATLRVIASFLQFVVIPGMPNSFFYKLMPFYMASYGPDVFISEVGLLLVVLLGTLLARRHGRLAILLPLGYMVPALYGLYCASVSVPANVVLVSCSSYPAQFVPFIAVVLVRYLLIGVVAPVWIVRSASERGRLWAGMITLLVGVGIEVFLSNFWKVGATINTPFDIVGYFSGPLITAVGIALALCLYRGSGPAQPTSQLEGGIPELSSA